MSDEESLHEGSSVEGDSDDDNQEEEKKKSVVRGSAGPSRKPAPVHCHTPSSSRRPPPPVNQQSCQKGGRRVLKRMENGKWPRSEKLGMEEV